MPTKTRREEVLERLGRNKQQRERLEKERLSFGTIGRASSLPKMQEATQERINEVKAAIADCKMELKEEIVGN
jgi:Protein of unknown function (DUF1204)